MTTYMTYPSISGSWPFDDSTVTYWQSKGWSIVSSPAQAGLASSAPEMVGAHPAAGSIAGWLYPLIAQAAGSPQPHTVIPQLTPAPFTMPANGRPVGVILSIPGSVVNQSFPPGTTFNYGLDFTKNAGANKYQFESCQYSPASPTSAVGNLGTIVGYLPTGSVSTSATSRIALPGDTIQVTPWITLDSSRTVTDGATNTSTTVTSNTAQFTSADVNRDISGGTIPAGTKISSVTNPFTVVISAAASGTATGVTIKIGRAARAVADGVTNSTTTVTSATAVFTSGDVGKAISGGTIPAGATIVSVTNATTVVISAAATGSASSVALNVGDWFQLACGDDFLGTSNANYWPYCSVIQL